MADKIVKQVKVLGPVGDMLSFVGGIFSVRSLGAMKLLT